MATLTRTTQKPFLFLYVVLTIPFFFKWQMCVPCRSLLRVFFEFTSVIPTLLIVNKFSKLNEKYGFLETNYLNILYL